MSSTNLGVFALVMLVLWSNLAFLLGRGFGPDRSAEHDPGSWGDTLPWLIAILVGLVTSLLWGELSVFGVPAIWVTVLPIAGTYSALVFDLGRPPCLPEGRLPQDSLRRGWRKRAPNRRRDTMRPACPVTRL